MRQQSVVLKFGLLFSVFYLFYNVLFFGYFATKDYALLTQKTYEDASNYLRIGRTLLKDGDIVDLEDRLSAGLKSHQIDYYLIRKGGEDLVYANAAGANDPVYFPQGADEGMFETDSYRHFIIKENGFELAVGHKVSFWRYFWLIAEQSKEYVLKEIVFLSSLVVLLAFYSLRDLRAIIGRLAKFGADRSDNSFVKSKEAHQLVQGLKGFENTVEGLSEENRLLKGQVLPALQKELWSGKKPPYDFGCTLVRTDINDFTKIFSSSDRLHFLETINRFFLDLTHIVSRYRGFVYEFIGDEVIFYFKDEDHQNSSAIALSALRDINRLAERVNDETEEVGYAFRIKSSMSHGVLNFGPLVNGYSLSGGPLIETVRILSHVHEKAENTILFDENVLGRVSFLCTTKENKVVMLKGLPGSRRLHSYQAHVPLMHHLRQQTNEHFALATFYRDDNHICEVLDFLRERHQALSQESGLQLLSHFRTFQLTRSSVELRHSYVELVKTLLAGSRASQDSKESFLLSATIAAAVSFFKSGEFSGAVREVVLECIELDNRRIIANAVDVFSELDSGACEQIFGDLLQHKDNRIAANALVKEGKKAWSKQIARHISYMLKQQSPYYKASGLYAIGEIAGHFFVADKVAFHANTEIQSLLNEISKLVCHPNRMVRRQAMRAALKADRLQDLYQIKNGSVSLPPDVRSEIHSFLDQFDTKGSAESGFRVA